MSPRKDSSRRHLASTVRRAMSNNTPGSGDGPHGRGGERSKPWEVWHGKARKAVRRLQAISEELEKWPGQNQSALWWNVRKACKYIGSQTRYLVNYGARYRKSLPISSGIAESAVNQVVSLRMAKKRQMRWSDQGAHVLSLSRLLSRR